MGDADQPRAVGRDVVLVAALRPIIPYVKALTVRRRVNGHSDLQPLKVVAVRVAGSQKLGKLRLASLRWAVGRYFGDGGEQHPPHGF